LHHRPAQRVEMAFGLEPVALPAPAKKLDGLVVLRNDIPQV
jgi:hypothetical protein